VKNFVVLSRMRTGSHMVMSFLLSNPHVYCHSDFNTSSVEWNGLRWLCKVGFSKQPEAGEDDYRAVGFLLKTKTRLYEKVLKEKAPKVIYLTRENKLRMCLSKKLAKVYGCYDDPAKNISINQAISLRKDSFPIILEEQELLKFFIAERQADNKTMKFLKKENIDFIHIKYEDLLVRKNRQLIAKQAFEHLGVPNTSWGLADGRGRRRLDTRSIRKSIANYDQLKDFFSYTPLYAKFFEE